jgi:hypothetical protein
MLTGRKSTADNTSEWEENNNYQYILNDKNWILEIIFLK